MSDESPADRFKSVLPAPAGRWRTSPRSRSTGRPTRPVQRATTSACRCRAAACRARGDGSARLCRQLRAEAAPPQRRPARPPCAGRAGGARLLRCGRAVRYEALGANAYAGIRGQPRCRDRRADGGDPITRAASPEEVPVQAALALLLRERSDRPAGARSGAAGVDMLRGWIEDKRPGRFRCAGRLAR
jgi:cobaltochelatase CobT